MYWNIQDDFGAKIEADVKRLADTEFTNLPRVAREAKLRGLFAEEFLENCFNHLDKDASGSISLKEFLRSDVFETTQFAPF